MQREEKNKALIKISLETLNMFMPYDIVIETIGGVTRMKKLILMVVLAVVLMSGCAHSTIDETSVDSTMSSEELRIKEDLEM